MEYRRRCQIAKERKINTRHRIACHILRARTALSTASNRLKLLGSWWTKCFQFCVHGGTTVWALMLSLALLRCDFRCRVVPPNPPFPTPPLENKIHAERATEIILVGNTHTLVLTISDRSWVGRVTVSNSSAIYNTEMNHIEKPHCPSFAIFRRSRFLPCT